MSDPKEEVKIVLAELSEAYRDVLWQGHELIKTLDGQRSLMVGALSGHKVVCNEWKTACNKLADRATWLIMAMGALYRVADSTQKEEIKLNG